MFIVFQPSFRLGLDNEFCFVDHELKLIKVNVSDTVCLDDI